MEENNIQNVEKKKNYVVLYIIVIGIIILIGIGIGYFLYINNRNEEPIDDTSKTEQKETTRKYKSTELEKSLGLEYPYIVEQTIKKQDGTIVGYAVCKVEEDLYELDHNHIVCQNNTTYYYTIKNENKSKVYDYIKYLDDKYVVATYYNDLEFQGCDLLDISTGKIEKKLNYIGLEAKNYNSETYYVARKSEEEDDYAILNNEFKPIIKDIESYAYVLNNNNTITLIPNWEDKYLKYNTSCASYLPSKFFIYDLNGNKIYESKEYDHVVGIGINSNTGYGYGDLLVVNNGVVNIIDYKENIIKTLTKANICSVTDNQRIYGDYYFYLDDGMYKYDRNNDKLINAD